MTRGDVDYDARGVPGAGYAARRRTDPRIEALVHRALGPARSVVNVGAGAGSYEPSDRPVIAIEPSATMRAQRPPERAVAIAASAEHLPLETGSVEAAMAMVTVHQWSGLESGLREMRRVARGPVIVLTFDPAALQRFWLSDYVPEVLASEARRFPELGAMGEILGGAVAVLDVPVPRDCVDGFIEAYYARPEALLDDSVRAAQSAWTFVEASVVRRGLDRLAADLDSGAWDARYGELRTRPEYAGSLRLLVATP